MKKNLLMTFSSLVFIVMIWLAFGTGQSLEFQNSSVELSLNQQQLERLSKETESLLIDLIKVQSIRRNEKPAIDILEDAAKKEGFLTKRVLMDGLSSRPILLVEYIPEGVTKKNGLILANHIDVVEVQREEWSVNPFEGVVKEDRIYGRGALDMKGMAAIQFMTLVHAQRTKLQLDYPLMFLALPDEESGSGGANYLVENHLNLIEGYTHMINEGGFATENLPFPGATLVNINYAEKGSLWLKAKAKGPSGHGSTPPPKYATKNLHLFIKKVFEWRPRITITKETESFFAQLAKAAGFPKSFALKRAAHPLIFPLVKPVIKASKHLTAMTTHSRSLTSLQSPSFEGVNVIPSEASATFDFRLLPTIKSEEAFDEISKIAKDFGVELEVVEKGNSTISPLDDQLFKDMGAVAKKVFPGSVVTPLLPPGITDISVFRRIGFKGYGLIPIKVSASQIDGMHGKDEYITRQNLKEGLQYLTTLLGTYKANPSL